MRADTLAENKNARIASVLTGSLRAQVKQMLTRDGLGVEEIAGMLDLPEAVIADFAATLGRKPVPASGEVEDPASAAISRMEHRMLELEERACEAYSDLLDSDSELIRMRAAERVQDILAGKLRPTKVNNGGGGVTIESMNIMLQEAVKAHQAQIIDVPRSSATHAKEITVP